MNWVDRRFAAEQNVLSGAPEIWQKVLTAIEDSCRSFIQNSNEPAVNFYPENGHAMVVRAEFSPRPYPGRQNGIPRINSVRVVFDRQRNVITAVLNDQSPKEFSIDGAEDGCFITYKKERIDPDRLSELVLDDAFHKAPRAENPARYSPGFTGSPWL